MSSATGGAKAVEKAVARALVKGPLKPPSPNPAPVSYTQGRVFKNEVAMQSVASQAAQRMLHPPSPDVFFPNDAVPPTLTTSSSPADRSIVHGGPAAVRQPA